VQRVTQASVTVEGRVVGSIGRGLVVLVGCAGGDTENDARYIADKVANLRVFEDDAGRMNLSVLETDGEALFVPNFTLLGDIRKGRRPSFTAAMEPERADELLRDVIAYAKGMGLRVGQGQFGARMQVALINEGPVTVLLDSTRQF